MNMLAPKFKSTNGNRYCSKSNKRLQMEVQRHSASLTGYDTRRKLIFSTLLNLNCSKQKFRKAVSNKQLTITCTLSKPKFGTRFNI